MNITTTQMDELNHIFKRIFALPISRLTIREVQNGLTSVFQDSPDTTKAIYESFLTGKINTNLKNDGIANLIEQYTFHVQMASEVAEMGEFVNSFSCDFFQQGNQIFFINRMRRIDGTEYHFLSAPDTNIRLAHMFINRLQDLKNSSKEIKFDQRLKDELESIKTHIDNLLK